MATILDFILEEDKQTYAAIIERAAEAKANAPKAPRKPRAPRTPEQIIKATQSRIEKLQAKLEALKAADTE
ncbi:MAG: hypothetical protein WCS08_06880 [Eubacteriales bacterium]